MTELAREATAAVADQARGKGVEIVIDPDFT